MKTILRVLGAPFVIGLVMLMAMSPMANANATASGVRLPNSPYSTGFLMAQAIHSGAVKLSGRGAPASANPDLSCKPAPCVLPNVQASEGGQPVNEDPIAANPNNNKNLLTGGNDYNCGSLQGFYASFDGGKTWNHTCMNTLSGASGDGDPGVGFDMKGNAYISGIDTGTPDGSDIVFEKSTDGGKTYSAPAVAVKPLFSGGLTDKDWLWVDDSASSKFVNSVYISITQFDSASDSEISVSNTHDGGKTWKTVAVDTKQIYPSEVDQFSDLTTDKAGDVFVTWMRCPASSGSCSGSKATFYVSESTDGGNTWSAPVVVNQANLAPGTCGFYGCIPNTQERLSDIPVIGSDNSTGKHAGYLYVENYNYNGKFTSEQVTTSTDGGKTWGTPVAVAPKSDTHDQFFGWLDVSATGQIGVTWMDRRNDPSNLSYEEFGAVSGSASGLVKHNVQLAAKPSNPNNDGFGGSFMGDYTGNVWAGKKLYASWMDTSNGTNCQDEVGGYSSTK